MKQILLVIAVILSVSLFFACGESGPTEKELALEAKIDSLQDLREKDKESIKEYVSAINEIQAGLDKIKQQEKILVNRASSDNELQESDVEMINNDIETIYEMMVENRKKLDYLRNKLNKSGNEMAEFKTSVEQLTAQLNEKDMEIKELQAIIQQKDLDLKKLSERLNEMAVNIERLEDETAEKAEVIEEQEDELNTAYYVIGDKSFLKDKNVITKEGGFIGIGGVQKIRKSSSAFTEIDIREKTEIELESVSKLTFLTDHPESSYSAETDENEKYIRLKISDPQAFWGKSKYLVIMTR
jgi:chromosome segregation ATPase